MSQSLGAACDRDMALRRIGGLQYSFQLKGLELVPHVGAAGQHTGADKGYTGSNGFNPLESYGFLILIEATADFVK